MWQDRKKDKINIEKSAADFVIIAPIFVIFVNTVLEFAFCNQIGKLCNIFIKNIVMSAKFQPIAI